MEKKKKRKKTVSTTSGTAPSESMECNGFVGEQYKEEGN